MATYENRGSEDLYVRLARASVEKYIRTGSVLEMPEGLPPEMTGRRAGVFVSIHENGMLRGCIGTIQACTDSVACEIIDNAVSASTRDPRFERIGVNELESLEISVDVLGDAERISSTEELDPKRYGVIVTKGMRRGLLLPDLEGVDSALQQVSIAMQKAGIPAGTEGVELERFEVVRHY